VARLPPTAGLQARLSLLRACGLVPRYPATSGTQEKAKARRAVCPTSTHPPLAHRCGGKASTPHLWVTFSLGRFYVNAHEWPGVGEARQGPNLPDLAPVPIPQAYRGRWQTCEVLLGYSRSAEMQPPGAGKARRVAPFPYRPSLAHRSGRASKMRL
jgi:hypothetical protein